MYKYSLAFLFALSVIGCKKESSTPVNPVIPPVDTTHHAAVFTFASTSGNCDNATVYGNYASGYALDGTNKVVLQINVTTKGTYTVSTTIVNNYRFSATGTFTQTGLQTVTLQGSGEPYNVETDIFPITAGSSLCSFTVGVIDPSLFDNDNMFFGNPSKAAHNTDSLDNYLMRKPYYAISYSSTRGTPNWSSWHLFADDIGTIPRQDDFREDVTLPAGWYRVTDGSYSSAGFDRGHNTPSGDRDRTVDANSSTFLMTNMIPQAPNNNQITWARMEDSLRRLVTLGNEVYIIMGSYGVGGTGLGGYTTSIDGGHVTVPSNIWKIAVVLPDGNGDSARVTAATRVIAVNVPNINTVGSNWKNYRVSVDAIEAATGYDLLSRLPPALQAILEARIDNL